MQSRFISILVVLSSFALLTACGDDGDTQIPSDPGENGENLPSGGTPSNPAGKYVGRFLTEGWQVDPELAGNFPVCQTDMVYIDADLNLVVGDESSSGAEREVIPLTREDDRYTAEQVFTEGDVGQLTVNITLSYNQSAERWEAAVAQEFDEEADGTPEASGQATFRLEPRLDWTGLRDAANGTFDSINVVSRPAGDTEFRPYVMVGGGSADLRERFQINPEGVLQPGSGPSVWFYEGSAGTTGLVTDGESNVCYEAVFSSLEADYAEMTVRALAPPETITEPDLDAWDLVETVDYFLYGGATDQPDLQQDSVAVAAMAGSQVDIDTDGEDAADAPYFYFGDDIASGLTAEITLSPIATGVATLTLPPESGEGPFELSYGYMRVGEDGYLVMSQADSSGSPGDGSVTYDAFVFAVDEQGQLTGDGLLQGYDFPILDESTAVNLEEWEAMDNEGLLMFGQGLDAALFDFVTTPVD